MFGCQSLQHFLGNNVFKILRNVFSPFYICFQSWRKTFRRSFKILPSLTTKHSLSMIFKVFLETLSSRFIYSRCLPACITWRSKKNAVQKPFQQGTNNILNALGGVSAASVSFPRAHVARKKKNHCSKFEGSMCIILSINMVLKLPS